MTDTVTISRECAEKARSVFKRLDLYRHVAEIEGALSSPPRPSGLREALEKIKFIAEGEGEVCLTWGTEDRAAFSRKQIIELCIAALASPDDGWVKVDEGHPMPGPDENFEYRGEHVKRMSRLTHYRCRPIAEQGE